jgi:hypothetical protein
MLVLFCHPKGPPHCCGRPSRHNGTNTFELLTIIRPHHTAYDPSQTPLLLCSLRKEEEWWNLNPPKYFADRVDKFLHPKIDPQQKKLEEFMEGITQKSSSKIYDSMDSLLLRFAKWRKGSSRRSFHQSSRSASVGCNTHGPAPWVSCMAARGM